MISYAMLPPMPSAEAPASVRQHALQQLRQVESRLQELQGTRPPLPRAQRLLVDSLSLQVAGDLARLAQALLPGRPEPARSEGPAAGALPGVCAYQGVAATPASVPGRGLRVEA